MRGGGDAGARRSSKGGGEMAQYGENVAPLREKICTGGGERLYCPPKKGVSEKIAENVTAAE